MITFALPKGRLADKVMAILNKVDISCDEMNEKSRKLIFNSGNYNFFLSKTSDVPTYVENGVADIGVVGKDTLLEEDRNLYEVLDLNLGKCKMMVAGFPDFDLSKVTHIKVATKYPRVAKEYFHSRGINISIVKLNGSVELGPIVGLSDVIVDIVETGSTLKENGLVVLEDICDLSARLIVNKVSMKKESKEINDIIKKIKLEIE